MSNRILSVSVILLGTYLSCELLAVPNSIASTHFSARALEPLAQPPDADALIKTKQPKTPTPTKTPRRTKTPTPTKTKRPTNTPTRTPYYPQPVMMAPPRHADPDDFRGLPWLMTPTPTTGTIQSITTEADANGITTVLVTLVDDQGTTQTVRLSIDTAVSLGLVTLDPTSQEPVVEETQVGQTVEIDPNVIREEEPTEETPGPPGTPTPTPIISPSPMSTLTGIP